MGDTDYLTYDERIGRLERAQREQAKQLKDGLAAIQAELKKSPAEREREREAARGQEQRDLLREAGWLPPEEDAADTGAQPSQSELVESAFGYFGKAPEPYDPSDESEKTSLLRRAGIIPPLPEESR